MEGDYTAKYLKYKNKYLNLKKSMRGGSATGQCGGAENEKTVILYKADWCGHCRAFKNTWEQLQKEVKDVKFETIDADKDADKVQEAKIDGFPTLRVLVNNKIHEFNQERTLENVKSFIKEAN